MIDFYQSLLLINFVSEAKNGFNHINYLNFSGVLY